MAQMTPASDPVFARCHVCGRVERKQASDSPTALHRLGWRIRELGTDRVKHRLVAVCPDHASEEDW